MSHRPIPAAFGHNGGPPLEENDHVPPWGRGGFRTYFGWRAAHRAAWKRIPYDTVLRRQARAEKAGVAYEEYTLEILERGVYLQPDDKERIEVIRKNRRKRRRRTHL